MIGFRACHQNIAGKQKIFTFKDKYMHVAFEIQGFCQRKEKKLKISLLKGSLAVLKSFRLQRGKRKIGFNINGIGDLTNPVTNTFSNIKPQEIITQYA